MKHYKDFQEMFVDNTQHSDKAVFNNYLDLMNFTSGLRSYCKMKPKITSTSYKMVLTPSVDLGYVDEAYRVIDEVRRIDPEWANDNLGGCPDEKYLVKLLSPHNIYETKQGRGGAEYDNVEVYYWDGKRTVAEIEVVGNTHRADSARQYYKGNKLESYAPCVGVGMCLDDFCPMLYKRVEDIIRSLCDEIKTEYEKLEDFHDLAQKHKEMIVPNTQKTFFMD